MERPHDLVEEECWRLLSATSIGRIALSVDALPVIRPVQYYLDGQTLAICLGQHGPAQASLDEVVVAFAADAIDESTQSGWTVQVQGIAQIPLTSGWPRDCGQPAAGQVVHLQPVTVTGHRLSLCPFIAGF